MATLEETSTRLSQDLLVVADLGDMPQAAEVTQFLDSVNGIWKHATLYATDPVTRRPGIYLHGLSTAQLLPVLRVRRLRMESPLEVVFSNAAEGATPLAYIAVVTLAVERVVRLIMEWQLHRVALRRALHGMKLESHGVDLGSATVSDAEARHIVNEAGLWPTDEQGVGVRGTVVSDVMRLANHQIKEVKRLV